MVNRFSVQVWDRPSSFDLKIVSSTMLDGIQEPLPNGIIEIGKFEKSEDLEYRIGMFVACMRVAFSHLGIRMEDLRGSVKFEEHDASPNSKS